MNEDEIEDLKRRAGIASRTFMGDGAANQQDGCVMNEDVSPEMAKEILRRLARHVKPGAWAKAVEENPEWEGCLKPNLGAK